MNERVFLPVAAALGAILMRTSSIEISEEISDVFGEKEPCFTGN
jgi:hypothetical protein